MCDPTPPLLNIDVDEVGLGVENINGGEEFEDEKPPPPPTPMPNGGLLP